MEDKFDKIFSEKAKEVMENQEIPYNPEHWNMLLAKKKKDKKKLIFFWKIAAFLLIAVLAGGLGKYFFFNSDVQKHNNPKIIFDTKNDSLRIDSLKNNNRIFITSSDFDSLNNSDSKISKIDTSVSNVKKKSNFKKYIKTEDVIVLNKTETTEVNINSNNIAKNIIDSISENINNIDKHIININNKIAENIENKIVEDSISTNNAIAIIEKKLNKDSLNIKQDIALLEEEEEKLETKSKKHIKLSLDLSPSYNYNQESESSNVGIAGGITIDIPILNKFDINTGILYADQTINLIKPTNSLMDVVSSKSALISKSSNQLIEKQAVIKGFEIPINLKYNFSIDEKDLFISAGITSTSYIKENIEEKFLVNNRTQSSGLDTFGNNIVRYELVQTNSKVVTENDSSNFSFANILNFSMGMEFPLNNERQSIIIEPYFKYSLVPVTEQNLDFSSAGVHLRYNFSFKGKN